MHLLHDPAAPPADAIAFDALLAVDIRLGTIVAARAFPEARNPAHVVTIDFGHGVGLRKSAAQITVHYAPEELVGRRVMAVVNLPARQIGAVRSEVLLLGFADAGGAIRLATVDGDAPDGARLA